MALWCKEQEMNGLSTLIKRQKVYVDEQRLVLSDLQAQRQKIEDTIKSLKELEEKQRKLLREKPEMGLTYSAFLTQHVRRVEGLVKERAILDAAITQALDKLAALFEEQKRYEIAKEQREEELARQESARETILLDEIGSIAFARKKR